MYFVIFVDVFSLYVLWTKLHCTVDYASGQDRKGWWKVQKFERVLQDCPKNLPKASKSTSRHLDLFLKPLSTQKLDFSLFVTEEILRRQTKLHSMAIQIVEFLNGGYKIRKIFASESARKFLNFEFCINGELSKSAKKLLSKSIFYVKNHGNLSQPIYEHIFCYWHFLIKSICKSLYY